MVCAFHKVGSVMGTKIVETEVMSPQIARDHAPSLIVQMDDAFLRVGSVIKKMTAVTTRMNLDVRTQLHLLNRLLPGHALQTAARMSTSATMDSVYTCGMYAMEVTTVETTQMNGIAVLQVQ